MEARIRDLEDGMSRLNERLSHVATKFFVGAMVFAPAALLITLMLYLHGDMKDAMRSGLTQATASIERVADKLADVRENVAYLRAKHDPDSTK